MRIPSLLRNIIYSHLSKLLFQQLQQSQSPFNHNHLFKPVPRLSVEKLFADRHFDRQSFVREALYPKKFGLQAWCQLTFAWRNMINWTMIMSIGRQPIDWHFYYFNARSTKCLSANWFSIKWPGSIPSFYPPLQSNFRWNLLFQILSIFYFVNDSFFCRLQSALALRSFKMV